MTNAGQSTSRKPDGLPDTAAVPSTGIVAISRQGAQLAGPLTAALPDSTVLYVVDRFRDLAGPLPDREVHTFFLPLRPLIGQLFLEYRRLALFMPVGAAVRLLAPQLRHKHDDPAVVCVDDAGRFAVSLLSGHIGGADALAEEVAAVLGSQPVITSASHATDTLAVDLLGRRFGWRIEAEATTVTRVSAAVVNGERVGLFQDSGEGNWLPAGKSLPSHIAAFASVAELLAADCAAGLLITDRVVQPEDWATGDNVARLTGANTVIYRPRSLVVGIGCRRGVSRKHLELLLTETFQEHKLSLSSIRCLATASIKQDEPGLLELAEQLGVPLVCYEPGELNGLFPGEPGDTAGGESGSDKSADAISLTRSAAARRLVGVWGVAEPAALLASGSRELLVPRQKTDRATLAAARIPFTPDPQRPQPKPQGGKQL